MSDKKLSIVVLCYNKFNFTKSCLDDLSRLPSDHEIILIDNASTDETQNKLQNSKEIVYHRNPANLGFSGGSNIGYNLASSPNVLFLNNDIRVKSNYENWTQELINNCSYGLVGPTMGLLDSNFNFVKESNSYIDSKFSYMSGWCLASSKENFDKLKVNGGVFDPDFFAYFEDTSLSFRARTLNIPFKVIEVPVIHFGKQTSRQLNTYELYLKSKEIFINKWKNYGQTV